MDRDDTRPVAGPEIPLLLFGLASLAADLGSVLIKAPLFRQGVTAGDMVEAIGVYVVLALIFRLAKTVGPVGSRAAVWLGLAAITYAFGHGIHLAANSIHDLVERAGGGDPTGLLQFWDEHVGHYSIDSARVLFAIALTGMSARGGSDSGRRRRALPALLLGGIVYGFITFASAVEGQTVPLMLPFYALFALWAGIDFLRAKRRHDRRAVPGGGISRFFLIAALVALLLFAAWGIPHRGFPEFTKTGLIPSAASH